MQTQRSTLIIATAVALLPLIGIAALLWRRFYHDQAGNTARRVFKNSAVPTVIRLLVRALDFAFVLVLYDTFHGVDLNPYVLATLLVGAYLSTFTEFGLGILLTREAAKDQAATPRLFGITLGLRLLLVAAAVPLIGLVIGGYAALARFGWGQGISPVGVQAIWILALTLIPSAYSNAVTAIYNGNERMEVPAVMELVTAICGFLARLCALFFGFGIIGISWAAVGVSTITALLFLGLQLRDFFAPRIVWDWRTMAALVPVALPLMLNNLLNAVFFRFDTFIIQAFGHRPGSIGDPGNPVQHDLSDYRHRHDHSLGGDVRGVSRAGAAQQWRTRRAGRSAESHTANAVVDRFPGCHGHLRVSPGFDQADWREQGWRISAISANVLAILAWFLPLSFVNGLIQYVLIAIDKQRAITRAFVIGALFNLAANLAFIPLYGLYAASTITILSEIVLLLVFRPLLKREGLWPPLLQLVWRPALGAVAMGGALLAVRPVIGWVGAGALAPLIYTAMIWLLGGFGAEEQALARRVFGRSG